MGTSQNRTVLVDSTTYRISRTKTLIADVNSESPQTNRTSNPQTTGSHNQNTLGRRPNANTAPSNSRICTPRCKQLESTAAMGTTSRGTGTRLTSPLLSTIDVVPASHAIVKKLYGTRPQRTNTGKLRTFG